MNDNAPAKYPKVSVVVPVHNDLAHTLRFLESMSAVTYPNYDIILIDDGSTDGTSDAVARVRPDAAILKGDGNLWWTASVNMGVKAALEGDADYVLTINNDVLVGPGFIEPLVKCSVEADGAMVGAKVLTMGVQGRVWSAGGKIRWYSGKLFYPVDGDGKDGARYSGRREAEYLHAMGCLVPARVYRDVGLYDAANYPQYHADAEFSMRAARAGVRLMVEPESVIYNDTEHSKAWVIRKSLNLITPILDAHSPYSMKVNWKLYRDYAPNPFARFVGLLIKYVRYFIGTVRYLR